MPSWRNKESFGDTDDGDGDMLKGGFFRGECLFDRDTEIRLVGHWKKTIGE